MTSLGAGDGPDLPSAPPPPRVVFIGGIGRSGSTLLEVLLAATPGLIAVGETVHLWQRGILDGDLCSCGEPFDACPFWRRVGHEAFGSWSPKLAHNALDLQAKVDRTRFVPLTLGRQTPTRKARLDRYTRLYAELYRAVLTASRAEVVVDSSKHVSLAAALASTGSVDVRVVQLIRDPEAVARAWTKTVARPESAAGGSMPTISPVRLAGRWTLQNRLFDFVGRRSPRLVLRYEDLVRDPNATVRKARAFAGLDPAPDPVALDSTVERPVVHSVAGNPLRFGGGPLRIESQSPTSGGNLSWTEGALVRLITGRVAARYPGVSSR